MTDFKVRVLETRAPQFFTVGKEYRVSNGNFQNDRGFIYDNWALGNSGEFCDLTNWFSDYCSFELVIDPPRICYLLGGDEMPLEIGEKFEIEGYNGNPCRIPKNGIVYNRNGVSVSDVCLCNILNHPEKIIRKPKIEFTDDEKAMLRLYAGAGYLWVARNQGTSYIACVTEKPTKGGSYFTATPDSSCSVPKALLPQITFENSPIYIPDYVEVQGND